MPHLLLIHHSCLDRSNLTGHHLRLPRLLATQEHLLNLLERLPGSLGEEEEHVDRHRCTKHRKHDVRLPPDVDKRWGHEVRERKVEDPVRGCAERDSFTADACREQLWWVDPA